MTIEICEHEYDSTELGLECLKCGEEYVWDGTCPKPNCDVKFCQKHTLAFPTLDNDNTFKDVLEQMNDDIYVLNLGHDGVIDGEEDDIRKVLAYPNLRKVVYCGYYTQDYVLEIFKNFFEDIEFIPRY